MKQDATTYHTRIYHRTPTHAKHTHPHTHTHATHLRDALPAVAVPAGDADVVLHALETDGTVPVQLALLGQRHGGVLLQLEQVLLRELHQLLRVCAVAGAFWDVRRVIERWGDRVPYSRTPIITPDMQTP